MFKRTLITVTVATALAAATAIPALAAAPSSGSGATDTFAEDWELNIPVSAPQGTYTETMNYLALANSR